MINFRSVKGVDFLKTVLKRIELARDWLVLDIEQGREVFIPDDLSVKMLPLSFQYYDPVMVML